jgi:hypothetical protein
MHEEYIHKLWLGRSVAMAETRRGSRNGGRTGSEPCHQPHSGHPVGEQNQASDEFGARKELGYQSYLMNGKLNVTIWLDIDHIYVAAIKIAVNIDSCGYVDVFTRRGQGCVVIGPSPDGWHCVRIASKQAQESLESKKI